MNVLTEKQKAEIFDWFCICCECAPFASRAYGDDYGHFCGVALYSELTKKQMAIGKTAEEALYNAYIRDQKNA